MAPYGLRVLLPHRDDQSRCRSVIFGCRSPPIGDGRRFCFCW